jgi:hypothetical protein
LIAPTDQIVDEHIESALLITDSIHESLDLNIIAIITPYGYQAIVRGQSLRTAPGSIDSRATLCQNFRNATPNAIGGSGYKGY